MMQYVLLLYSVQKKEALLPENFQIRQKKCINQLLEQGFSSFFQLDSFDVNEIKKDEFGKPFYEKNPELYFNITHNEKVVAVAFSYFPIGIDVESNRKVKRRTCRHVCNQQEMDYVFFPKDTEEQVYLNPEQTYRFLQLWTLKESEVKRTGKGLREDLSKINFPLTSFKNEWIEEVNGCTHYLTSRTSFLFALSISGSCKKNQIIIEVVKNKSCNICHCDV